MRKISPWLIVSLLASSGASAQVLTQQNVLRGATLLDPNKIKLNELTLDRVRVRDDVYSTSRKTELGDQTRLEMAFRYHTDRTTFARMRFNTNPTDNRFDNQTSSFEFIFSKRFKDLVFQLDLNFETNDRRSGGTNLGVDLNSDDTFVSYSPVQNLLGTFYPFNFRSDVGDEFGTPDVTTINYIDGSPATISRIPVGNERIITKTVPGVEFSYNMNGHQLYAGVGVASYLYPVNDDFNISTNPTANAWERKQMSAYKAGYLHFSKDARYNVQLVTQDSSKETGTLIQSAGSFTVFQRFASKYLVEVEGTMTKAGERPYRLNRGTSWFNDLTPFEPVFSDYFGRRQDWINKMGSAVSVKLGFNLTDTVVPYFLLKHQSEHFIFNGEESAHRLRTDDETKSHGGLTRIGGGTYFYYDNFFFRPEVEFRQAQNAVFSKATDLREDRILSSFKKNDMLITINVTYTFDGNSLNQNWWF